MFSLKQMKSLTNFCCLGTSLCPNCIFLNAGFTYCTLRPFSRNRQSIQIFKEMGDLSYIYNYELDKACFAHDTVYSDSKDLGKRIISDKVLKDGTYVIALNPKYDGYQRGLASMVFQVF